MKTAFGKCLAKIRVDFCERQTNMAKRLSVAPSFLSAIENGRKEVPLKLLLTICKEYSLDYQCRRILASSLCNSDSAIHISKGEWPERKMWAIMTILLDCYD